VTADQARSESDDGIRQAVTRQPRVTAETSEHDTFEDLSLFVRPQQYDVCNHPMDTEFGLLESMAGFSTANLDNYIQIPTVDSASTVRAVRRPFFSVRLYLTAF
jgi:hypothetical protein